MPPVPGSRSLGPAAVDRLTDLETTTRVHGSQSARSVPGRLRRANRRLPAAGLKHPREILALQPPR